MAAAHANFARLANEAGLEVGERSHWYNSTLAHEAAEWAHEVGPPEREEEFRRAIFRAYFVHDRNIADPEVLLDAAHSVGTSSPADGGSKGRTGNADSVATDAPAAHASRVELAPYTPEQRADLRAALADHRYLPTVQEQYQEAREIGVTGVPTFVAGGYALVGAHPYDHFHQLMATIGHQPRTTSAAESGAGGADNPDGERRDRAN